MPISNPPPSWASRRAALVAEQATLLAEATSFLQHLDALADLARAPLALGPLPPVVARSLRGERREAIAQLQQEIEDEILVLGRVAGAVPDGEPPTGPAAGDVLLAAWTRAIRRVRDVLTSVKKESRNQK